MGTVLLSVGHGDGSPVQRLGHVLDMAGHGDGSPVHSCPGANGDSPLAAPVN